MLSKLFHLIFICGLLFISSVQSSDLESETTRLVPETRALAAPPPVNKRGILKDGRDLSELETYPHLYIKNYLRKAIYKFPSSELDELMGRGIKRFLTQIQTDLLPYLPYEEEETKFLTDELTQHFIDTLAEWAFFSRDPDLELDFKIIGITALGVLTTMGANSFGNLGMSFGEYSIAPFLPTMLTLTCVNSARVFLNVFCRALYAWNPQCFDLKLIDEEYTTLSRFCAFTTLAMNAHNMIEGKTTLKELIPQMKMSFMRELKVAELQRLEERVAVKCYANTCIFHTKPLNLTPY
jgi:hypothetical protein